MRNSPEDIEQKRAAILVVDDDNDIRKLLRFKLQKIGYDVSVASNGHEAIENVKKIQPDLILLDLMMPKMDGFKTCEYLKNHKKFYDIPIIIVSAIGEIKSKAAAFASGADDYLTKPIDIITMAARVKSHLENKRLKNKLKREADKKALSNNFFDYQHLFERLEIALEKCRNESGDLEIRNDDVIEKAPVISLMYLDIDFMKMINMEYGFESGDTAIKLVRDVFYKELNEEGMIFFSNCDKMFAILPDIDEGRSYVLAHQILKEADRIILPINEASGETNKTLKVSVSIGLVSWNKVEKISSEKLFYYVESALNNAKKEGRGKNIQYQFYSKPLKNGSHVVDKKVAILTGGSDEI